MLKECCATSAQSTIRKDKEVYDFGVSWQAPHLRGPASADIRSQLDSLIVLLCNSDYICKLQVSKDYLALFAVHLYP